MRDEFDKMFFDLDAYPNIDVNLYIPIPDEHYAAIAKAIDAWADIEFAVDQLVWRLVSKNDRHADILIACVTAQSVSLVPRMDALLSLVRLLKIPDSGLAAWVGDMQRINGHRNRIVHDKRIVDAQTGQVARFQVSAKGTLKFDAVPETIADLMKFRDQLREMFRLFGKIEEALISDLNASPHRSIGPYRSLTKMRVPPPNPPSGE